MITLCWHHLLKPKYMCKGTMPIPNCVIFDYYLLIVDMWKMQGEASYRQVLKGGYYYHELHLLPLGGIDTNTPIVIQSINASILKIAALLRIVIVIHFCCILLPARMIL